MSALNWSQRGGLRPAADRHELVHARCRTACRVSRLMSSSKRQPLEDGLGDVVPRGGQRQADDRALGVQIAPRACRCR